jgi:hypothetical protein
MGACLLVPGLLAAEAIAWGYEARLTETGWSVRWPGPTQQPALWMQSARAPSTTPNAPAKHLTR